MSTSSPRYSAVQSGRRWRGSPEAVALVVWFVALSAASGWSLFVEERKRNLQFARGHLVCNTSSGPSRVSWELPFSVGTSQDFAISELGCGGVRLETQEVIERLQGWGFWEGAQTPLLGPRRHYQSISPSAGMGVGGRELVTTAGFKLLSSSSRG